MTEHEWAYLISGFMAGCGFVWLLVFVVLR